MTMNREGRLCSPSTCTCCSTQWWLLAWRWRIPAPLPVAAPAAGVPVPAAAAVAPPPLPFVLLLLPAAAACVAPPAAAGALTHGHSRRMCATAASHVGGLGLAAGLLPLSAPPPLLGLPAAPAAAAAAATRQRAGRLALGASASTMPGMLACPASSWQPASHATCSRSRSHVLSSGRWRLEQASPPPSTPVPCAAAAAVHVASHEAPGLPMRSVTPSRLPGGSGGDSYGWWGRWQDAQGCLGRRVFYLGHTVLVTVPVTACRVGVERRAHPSGNCIM